SPLPIPSLEGKAVSQMSIGNNHTLVMLEDGSVWGSGHNYYGELGGQSNATHFVQIPALANVQTIHAGFMRSFVYKDGATFAFGYDGWYGQDYKGLLGVGYDAYEVSGPTPMLDLRQYS